VLNVRESALRGFEAFFGTGHFLARARQRLKGGARVAVGRGELGFRLGKLVCCLAASSLGRLDLADDGAALLREDRRRAFERRPLRLRLIGPGGDGRDLRRRGDDVRPAGTDLTCRSR
jgi:hypothetical protein